MLRVISVVLSTTGAGRKVALQVLETGALGVPLVTGYDLVYLKAAHPNRIRAAVFICLLSKSN